MNGYMKSLWGGMLCLAALRCSCKRGGGALLLHPELRWVGGRRDPSAMSLPGDEHAASPRRGDRRVMAVAAVLRQSFIRGTKHNARDWLLLYVTEEEQQHQDLFFFFPPSF